MKSLALGTSNINKELIFIILFYGYVALSSLIDLGPLAAPGFIILLVACTISSPRMGFVALLAMFYLPMGGIKIPNIFIIATVVVGAINFLKNNKSLGFRLNREIVLLYSLFLLFRFISIVFVDNMDAFKSYFFVSFAVLIHIVVCSMLIKNREDILFILRIWGIIGVAASVLGYLHFYLQDSTYLRQIIGTDAIDKSAIEGSFDYVRWIWVGAEPNFHGINLLFPFVINLFFLVNKVNAVNIILTVVNFLGVLGTFSRTSFLVSLLVVVLFVFLKGGNMKGNNISTLLFGSIIIAAVGWLISAYFPDFVARFNTIQEAATSNQASGRLPLYKEALNNFIHNPIFGVGTGQTAYISAYRLESHNLFLQTLGENGLFGFALLLSIFVNFFKKANAVKYYNRVFMIAGIALFFNANTVSYFDMRPFFSLFVLLNFYYYWLNQSRESV